jgi:hypothetical protein
MFAQTPLAISKDIIRLCSKVVAEPEPFFIDVTPLPGFDPLQCFPNVSRQVWEHGGQRLSGWLVHIFPRVLAEFQFHAIWLQTNGTPLDITPTMPHCPGGVAEKVHLFLPDPNKSYKGQRVTNLQLALSKSTPVMRYLEASKKFEAAVSGGKQSNILTLAQAAENARQGLNWQPQPNDPCPCGSRKKYKVCPCHSP